MNRKEYNKCVEQYSDKVFRFILKNIRNEADAQDIVQNAFERLWINREKVTFEKARSYLFSIAHNNMIDTIRKVKRMDWVEEVPENSHQNENSRYELKEILDLGLSKLSEVQRSLILLRDYEGYSYKEIAQMTELSESQVKVYIFRGRKKLQEYLVGMDKAI